MMTSQTTLEEKIVELENSKQIPQNSRPKIQRVAEYLRNRKDFEKHYSPRFLSLGPIHHGSTNLKLGEKFKLMWAAKYIENIRLNPRDLHKKIVDNIDKLKGHFDDDVLTLTGKSLEGFGSLEEKLSWMLFVDGCFVLYILENTDIDVPTPGSMNIKLNQVFLVMMDVVLLENQLPYQVLKLLWKDNNESELIRSMRKFLENNHWSTPVGSSSEKEKDVVPTRKGEREHSVSIPNESQSEKDDESEGQHSVSIPNESQSDKDDESEGQHNVSIPNESQLETPTHLLDLQRKLVLTTYNSKTKSIEANNKKWSQMLLPKIKIWRQKNLKKTPPLITYRNIQDLRAVGIRLESSATQGSTVIDFSEGWFAAKLTLPEIIVNDTSATTFLNLIAYEMCPDFKNDYEICSYVAFIESLIDHPEDVKELRSSGILLNYLGSDEEVANLFNMISTDLVLNEDIYHKVRCKIDDHYRNKYKTWIAEGFHTYFSSPWTITAFTAALIVLVLTFIQTWFTINPPSK